MKFKGTLIVVKDCRKALIFYQDMFGLELIQDHDGNMELSENLRKAIKRSCILKSRRLTASYKSWKDSILTLNTSIA